MLGRPCKRGACTIAQHTPTRAPLHVLTRRRGQPRHEQAVKGCPAGSRNRTFSFSRRQVTPIVQGRWLGGAWLVGSDVEECGQEEDAVCRHEGSYKVWGASACVQLYSTVQQACSQS